MGIFLFGVLLVADPEAVAFRDPETPGEIDAFGKQWHALSPSVCCLGRWGQAEV